MSKIDEIACDFCGKRQENNKYIIDNHPVNWVRTVERYYIRSGDSQSTIKLDFCSYRCLISFFSKK